MADGLHYYEWFFNDWLASTTRADMSLNDRAIYRDLLDHQAANGSLPDDPQALANRAMCSTGQIDAFMRRWGDMLFPQGEDGARRNARLQANRDAILDRLDKRRSAGVKGAEARWHGKANGKRIADAMPRVSGSGSGSSGSNSSTNKPKPRENRGNARTPNPPKFPSELDTPAFREKWDEWLAYRREYRLPKWKPSTVEKNLKSLAKVGHDAAIETIDVSIQAAWRGLFPGRGTKAAGGNPQASAEARRADKASREYAEDSQLEFK